jgi:hypothetical protein
MDIGTRSYTPVHAKPLDLPAKIDTTKNTDANRALFHGGTGFDSIGRAKRMGGAM